MWIGILLSLGLVLVGIVVYFRLNRSKPKEPPKATHYGKSIYERDPETGELNYKMHFYLKLPKDGSKVEPIGIIEKKKETEL